MRRLLLIALALVAAACGADTTASTISTTAPPPASSAAPSTAADTTLQATSSTPTTAAPAASSSSAVPTTTVLGTGEPVIRIEEVVFAGEPYLIVGNRGSGPGSTAGYWICQFPSYYELPAVDLKPGERLAVPLGTGSVPELIGVVATAEVVEPLGTVTSGDGEVGLYSSNSFNSAEAIVDYVEWGSGGHARSSVAAAAGIWVTGGFVEVPPEVLAIVAQAFPTAAPEDWFAEIGG